MNATRLSAKSENLLPFGVLLCLLACTPGVKRTDELFSTDDTSKEIGKTVEILYSDSAILRVRVQAPTLHNYVDRDNPRQEFPDGIRVDFLNLAQQVQSTLTAKTATRLTEKSKIFARDSVVMTSVDQKRLETEELTWDEHEEKVTTEKFVKITTPDEIIYGFGLEANQDFSYWKIKVPKGRIKINQVNAL